MRLGQTACEGAFSVQGDEMKNKVGQVLRRDPQVQEAFSLSSQFYPNEAASSITGLCDLPHRAEGMLCIT